MLSEERGCFNPLARKLSASPDWRVAGAERAKALDLAQNRSSPPYRTTVSPSIAVELGAKIGIAMTQLLRFPSAVKRDSAIEVWMREHAGELGMIAQWWFKVMRDCGSDVRELLHDGHPTACVGDAAFAYVNAFTAHVNVGFFRGAELADPNRLLEGTGKFMRHVKLRPGRHVDAAALRTLVGTAYADKRTAPSAR